MKASSVYLALTQALIGCDAASSAIFRPQYGGVTSGGLSTLPLAYDLAATHTISDPSAAGANSHWISAFIHGSDNCDYFVMSNLAPFGLAGPTVYRASVLNINDPSKYTQYEKLSLLTNLYNKHGILSATLPHFGFGSPNSTDSISALRTWSDVSGAEFDLTVELSSPVLLNAGLGLFPVNGLPALQWSMPAGKTTGWIVVDGKKVDVVSSKSKSWYDRQWGSLPSNFTWFEIHLPGDNNDGSADQVYSLWTLHDDIAGEKAFVTMRVGTSAEQQRVLPVTWQLASKRTYHSPSSGIAWPLDWSLQVHEGPLFAVSSIRPDQETTGLLKFYTGYADVQATFPNGRRISGYGIVEAFIQ